VSEFVDLEKNEKVLALSTLDAESLGVALGTASGVVKRVLPDYPSNKDSFELIGLKDGDTVVGAVELAATDDDLVFVTSDVVCAPRPGMASYVASKFAVDGMVAALGMELEGTGVRVSCVRPGPTLTEMGWDWDPDQILPQLDVWKYWGVQRHMHFMAPADVAGAVAAVVGAPPGAVFRVIEVQPVPPYEEPSTT